MNEPGAAARLSCFSLIASIESDLRRYLADVFVSAGVPDFLHPDLRRTASERRSRDGETNLALRSGDFALMDYLDFGDLSALIFTHSAILPSASAKELLTVAKDLVPLCAIRNRVCHSRPLEIDDFSTLNDAAVSFVLFKTLDWPDLKSALKLLRENPGALLRVTLPHYWADAPGQLQHNLPVPEFEDTGFIGRSKDVANVTKHLLGPFPVVSIIGEGGLGKTTLALKVLYDLLDNPVAHGRFDAVCWVTLKTHRLTSGGIAEIDGAIRDALGLFREAAQVIGVPASAGRSKSDTLKEVLEYMREFKILLALDNCETIGDLTLLEFLRDLSGSSKVLITSRIGMGQIELAYPLVPLDEKDSAQLMRRAAKAVNLMSVLQAKQERIEKWCSRLHFNPLAIKWFVSAVALGKDPARLTDPSSTEYKELLRFSFENLYDGLTDEARMLVQTLSVIGRPVSRTELFLILEQFSAKLEHDKIDLALTVLFNASVIRRATTDSVESTASAAQYHLTEFANHFVRQLQTISREFASKIQRAVNRLRDTSESAQRDIRYDKYNGRAVRARTKDERLVVSLLTQACRELDSSRFEAALAILHRADELLPQFVETHRIRAYALTQMKDLMRARNEYEIARECDPSSQIAMYDFAKFLAFELEDYDAAAELTDTLVASAPEDIQPKALRAVVETRRGNYELATTIYEQLLLLPAADQRKRNILYQLDQAAECYRRWSEHHLEYKEASLFRKCVTRALTIILEGFRAGHRDWQIEQTLANTLSLLMYGSMALKDSDTVIEVIKLLSSFHRELPASIVVKASPEKWISQFKGIPGFEEMVRRLPIHNHRGPVQSREELPVEKKEYKGRVCTMAKVGDYAFIDSDGARWFFHKNHMKRQLDWNRVHVGVWCRFEEGQNAQGKCAVNVIVES